MQCHEAGTLSVALSPTLKRAPVTAGPQQIFVDYMNENRNLRLVLTGSQHPLPVSVKSPSQRSPDSRKDHRESEKKLLFTHTSSLTGKLSINRNSLIVLFSWQNCNFSSPQYFNEKGSVMIKSIVPN